MANRSQNINMRNSASSFHLLSGSILRFRACLTEFHSKPLSSLLSLKDASSRTFFTSTHHRPVLTTVLPKRYWAHELVAHYKGKGSKSKTELDDDDDDDVVENEVQLLNILQISIQMNHLWFLLQ